MSSQNESDSCPETKVFFSKGLLFTWGMECDGEQKILLMMKGDYCLNVSIDYEKC